MNVKKGRIIGLTILLMVVIFTSLYLGLTGYYMDRFCNGTWINGIYCTGKSVEEVNQELTEQVSYDRLTVIDRNNVKHEIALSDIDYQIDFRSQLRSIKQNQSQFGWIRYFWEEQRKEIMPTIIFSEEKLTEALLTADFMTEEVLRVDNGVEIVKTENGYALKDHTVNQIVPAKVCLAAQNALYDLKEELYIEKVPGCYVTMPATRETLDIYRLWNQIYAFQNFKFTYLFGDREEKITCADVAEWILIDETTGSFVWDAKGNLVLDEAAVMDYVIGLGEKYDTVDRPREFLSTRGDVVTIEKSTYGNDIDEEAECALLIEEFKMGRSGTVREPVYAQKAWSQGENDIGDTYIEVDMTEQMLYYYVDGEIVLETPVVTGNMRRGWDTPAVVCSIYGRARNRTLRGANYATFVYYWMPVYGNIGLHDATWRREFGGEIYMTDGSHGCINMPKDKAAELYDMVEMGTPVVLFY